MDIKIVALILNAFAMLSTICEGLVTVRETSNTGFSKIM